MTAAGGALRAKLQADAARFDDAALEHLSNRGLVRRAKKLLRADLTLTASAESVDVSAGDWSVSFPAEETLTTGRCACATAGVCQHVVAAIIYLRDQSTIDGETTDRSPPPPESAPTTPAMIRAALLELTDDELLAWSKKTDANWAHTRLASIDPADVIIDQVANLNVVLPTPHGAVRFMGPALDSAIVKPSGRHDRRLVTLAVLALWAIEGRTLVPPAGTEAKPTELVPERRRVVERAQFLCRKLVTIGLLHLGDADREHLDSLAASARGVKLHRLALLAERASDEIQALSDQTPDADTARLLDWLAEINVVAELIDRLLGEKRALPEGVAGVARARFEPIGQLEVSCVGTYTWGDRRFAGSTAVLVDEGGRAYTVSSPNRVAGRQLPEAIGWTGCSDVASLAGRRIVLAKAKASRELRLSTSAETQATLGAHITESDLGQHVWDGARPAVPSRLLGRVGANWRIVAVTGSEPIRFDELEQRSIWTITSPTGSIDVVLPYRPANLAAIHQLEVIASTGRPDLIVGRMRTAGRRIELWPISAFVGGSFINLATAPVENPTHVMSGEETGPADAPPDHLERLTGQLVGLAERGVRDLRDARLDAFARTSDSWGFRPVAAVLARADEKPDLAMLRASWVLTGLRDLQA